MTNSRRPHPAILLTGLLVLGSLGLTASGPAALYAIVQQVVLEPNETAPPTGLIRTRSTTASPS